jgi:hypothetical protein
MNELRRHGRELLDEARRERTPDAAARERVFRALQASTDLASTPGADAPLENEPLAGFSRWLALAGLAALLVGGLYLAGHVGSCVAR